jgi:hypothetical protein
MPRDARPVCIGEEAKTAARNSIAASHSDPHAKHKREFQRLTTFAFTVLSSADRGLCLTSV